MTPNERRATLGLAGLYALRMLGLFLILPVFSIHAASLPGGQNLTLVGLAMGIYGLTQAFLQIPFGMASDRYGRKPVIVLGLILFALGSFVAAFATDLFWVTVGRAIQGAGAISAAVTAMLADATRDSVRTKAMALIGASIGLTFAISLVGAPFLYRAAGMDGIFNLTGVLALAAIWVILKGVPDIPRAVHTEEKVPFARVLANPELLRLNFGIFSLHLVQMAAFVIVPRLLVDKAGLSVNDHWMVYLPAVLVSFVVMMPVIGWGERRGQVRTVFLASIGMMALVFLGFVWTPETVWGLGGVLLAFFVAFNLLEASLPSLVSRFALPSAKGAALGVYNTSQAFGLAVGGVVGGWMAGHWGPHAVFWMSAGLMLLWWGVAFGMRAVPSRQKA